MSTQTNDRIELISDVFLGRGGWDPKVRIENIPHHKDNSGNIDNRGSRDSRDSSVNRGNRFGTSMNSNNSKSRRFHTNIRVNTNIANNDYIQGTIVDKYNINLTSIDIKSITEGQSSVISKNEDNKAHLIMIMGVKNGR